MAIVDYASNVGNHSAICSKLVDDRLLVLLNCGRIRIRDDVAVPSKNR